MAPQTQDLLYNVTGQSVIFDCPEGRPSSITSVNVFPWSAGDDGTAETIVDGSASVETNPDTTIDAASGKSQTNPRVLNVAATTGAAIDRTYLVTSAAGKREEFTVDDISSGVSLTSRHALHSDYASADTVESTRISFDVLAAWIQDSAKITDGGTQGPSGGWRVRWEYVVSSLTYVHDSYFDVARYRGEHRVLPTDVEDASPGWKAQLPREYQSDDAQRTLIQRAYSRVKMELYAHDQADQLMRDEEVMSHLIILKTIENTAQTRLYNGGPLDPMLEARRDYDDEFNRLIKVVSKVPVAQDSSGAGGKRTSEPVFKL